MKRLPQFMKLNLLSIDELTQIAKTDSSMTMRELALREIAHRDNHIFNPPQRRYRRMLRTTDYALSDSIK